jgi:hypothetical protein
VNTARDRTHGDRASKDATATFGSALRVRSQFNYPNIGVLKGRTQYSNAAKRRKEL